MKLRRGRWPLILCVASVISSVFGGAQVRMGEARIPAPPKERWSFTSKGHFSWYALLALSPIYRDQIRAAIVAPENVYLTVGMSGGGTEILALDRQRGQIVWQKRVSVEGWPITSGLIKVADRLVMALYEGRTKQLIVLALNTSDGGTHWQIKLPVSRPPAIYDRILDPDARDGSVNVYFPENKQRNRLILGLSDGERRGEKSYDGYLWPYGTRRAAGLVFGYDGVPHERKYHKLLAFNEEDGQLAWTVPLSLPWASPPTYVGDSLFITSGSKLVRLDTKNGNPIWSVDLGGRIPLNAEPPLVLGEKIIVVHAASADPESEHQKVSVLRFADGKRQSEANLYNGEWVSFNVLREMGDFIIVGSHFIIQLVEPKTARVLGPWDFSKLLSRFVYSDPPSMRVADNDTHAFVVVTSDGKLRYFAAEDFRSISSSQVSPTEKETSGFNISMIFFYLVVNPLWNMVLPNRVTFLVLFYSLPLLMIGLVWLWRPVWVLLQRKGLSRRAKWGAWIGLLLSLPAAIYRGLIGGIATGFGLYGSFGPIWGGFVGFSTFMVVGLLLGVIIGSLCSLVWRQVRWRTRPDD
jgi:outer membrane protein assembly factor BamB